MRHSSLVRWMMTIRSEFFSLGFDTHARILELVALHYDDGNVEVIHAMKARRHYLDLLD